MDAIYYHGDGKFKGGTCEVKTPEEKEVRIAVAYCGICGTDMHIAHGAMDGRVPSPMVIGHEMSGIIAEVGASVKDLSVGDLVVVRPLDNRREKPSDRGYSHICEDLKFIGIDSPGAFQRYWTVPAFTVHKLPKDADLKLAALVEPLAVACHDVRMAKVQKGELAVVIGGGPIGILVALVAKNAGANVIISEVNESRLTIAESMGIKAVNPLRDDLKAEVREQSEGSGADIVFEVSGSKAAAKSMTELLAIRGRILLVAIYPKPVEIDLFQFFWKELNLQGARVYEESDYEAAIELISSNTLPLSNLITQVAPLKELPEIIKSDTTTQGMKTLIKCS